ncbi:hypothetical protein GDO78_018583 [Eleutherodactylus coqui]|uniref:Uncharacterized protein n=1 Tax=Eleutherodactylus coqui TaxID=57060 RepID=A0A8J6BJ41_ELECQ|nr:hypothetical protein GDO78_018583 [Eleutherodactylus coqui]
MQNNHILIHCSEIQDWVILCYSRFLYRPERGVPGYWHLLRIPYFRNSSRCSVMSWQAADGRRCCLMDTGCVPGSSCTATGGIFLLHIRV